MPIQMVSEKKILALGLGKEDVWHLPAPVALLQEKGDLFQGKGLAQTIDKKA